MAATVQWGNSAGIFPYGFIATAQKEYVRNTEGTALAVKHTITIKGAVQAGTAGSIAGAVSLVDAISMPSDATARQVADFSATTNDINGNPIDMLGGTYPNARLVNASVGEPPEDTAGIQYVEVTATWEAYGAGDSGQALQSASDTLEVKKEIDKSTSASLSLDGGGLSFGYTVTHTVTAQGINTAGNNGYEQAKAWVDARAGTGAIVLNAAGSYNPNSPGEISGGSLNGVSQQKDINGNVISTTGGVTTSTLGQNLVAFGKYNAMKTTSSDVANGSYTVTTSYFQSAGSAFIDVTSTIQRDENGEATVSCQGTIEGLASGDADSTTDNRYANALAAFGQVSGDTTYVNNPNPAGDTVVYSPLSRGLDSNIADLGLPPTSAENIQKINAAQAYVTDLYKKPGVGIGSVTSSNSSTGSFGANSKIGLAAQAMWSKGPTDGLVLDTSYPISYSYGQNPPKGTITFSVSYKGYTGAVQTLRKMFDALTATLSISYDNRETALVQTIAVIPVIGRAKGPIIQDMGTTKEKRKVVQLDVTTKPTTRPLDNTAMIDAAIGFCRGFGPGNYISGSTGSWDVATGHLTAQVEWIFE